MTITDVPAEPDEDPAETWRRSLGYDGQSVSEGGKRCGLEWAPWMGDWFHSYSPRNDSSHAEGPWEHWVDLAIHILRDPMTAIVRPGAHAVVMEANLEPVGFYGDHGRDLTDAELMARFREQQP